MASQLKRPIQEGDGDSRHGTANAYNKHGCRCEWCTEAWRIHQARVRPPRPRRVEAKHGTRSKYKAGCRCEPCRKAERVYRAVYRAAQRAAVDPKPRKLRRGRAGWRAADTAP